MDDKKINIKISYPTVNGDGKWMMDDGKWKNG